jgi:hypothetical protein
MVTRAAASPLSTSLPTRSTWTPNFTWWSPPILPYSVPSAWKFARVCWSLLTLVFDSTTENPVERCRLAGTSRNPMLFVVGQL